MPIINSQYIVRYHLFLLSLFIQAFSSLCENSRRFLCKAKRFVSPSINERELRKSSLNRCPFDWTLVSDILWCMAPCNARRRRKYFTVFYCPVEEIDCKKCSKRSDAFHRSLWPKQKSESPVIYGVKIFCAT